MANAVAKYGWENFTHEILADNLTLDEASDAEKRFIEEYHSTDRRYGYNLTDGGYIGYHLPDATRELIRQQHIGMRCSEETKQKIREKALGRIISSETREKISRANAGRYVSEEVRLHAGQGRKGIGHSPEAKAKLSEIAKVTRNRRKRVICVETGEIYESARAASISLGLVQNAVTSTIYQGAQRTCGGYHWKYLDKGVDDLMSISEEKVRANIVMPKDLKAALMKIAEKENRSFGNLVVTILQNYLQTTK